MWLVKTCRRKIIDNLRLNGTSERIIIGNMRLVRNLKVLLYGSILIQYWIIVCLFNLMTYMKRVTQTCQKVCCSSIIIASSLSLYITFSGKPTATAVSWILLWWHLLKGISPRLIMALITGLSLGQYTSILVKSLLLLLWYPTCNHIHPHPSVYNHVIICHLYTA